MLNKNVLIIGLGLIGGSFAKGLTKAGYTVRAYDPNEDSINTAVTNTTIKEGSTNAEDFINISDIIIFCCYPSAIIPFIKEWKHLFNDKAILTDVSGVKSNIINEAQELLTQEYVGAHPMAGRETSGYDNSDETIFYEANFIITPTDKNTTEGINTIKQLATDLNFNRISILDPKSHDEMIGFLSQLTHVIAVTLMNTKDNTHLVDYTGDSFRDLTRIAKINENMWSELFVMNKDILLNEITLFQKQLEIFKNTLEIENIDKMKELFIQSTERRKLFEK